MKKNLIALLLLSLWMGPLPLLAATTATVGFPKAWPITPRTAIKNVSVTYSAQVEDNELLKSCTLFKDDVSVGAMTIKKDLVYITHKIAENGTYQLYAKCKDTDENEVKGPVVSVVVSSGTSLAAAGDIIKSGCPAVVYPNHPCTAVYYFGVDGKRHAFTNERVYKSWFKDYSKMVIVSEEVMSDIPLGKNVTFRTGERLIKFSTNAVYAISYGGLLRPIANAEIAESLYGKDWVSLIETVDDVFFGNYRKAVTIESSKDFSWSAAKSETDKIDETL